MERVAAHAVTWGIAGSAATLLLAFSFLMWVEGTPDGDGPGVGIGLAIICGPVLLLLLAVVVVGTALLAFKQYQERRRLGGGYVRTFWIGSSYSMLAIAVLLLLVL